MLGLIFSEALWAWKRIYNTVQDISEFSTELDCKISAEAFAWIITYDDEREVSSHGPSSK